MNLEEYTRIELDKIKKPTMQLITKEVQKDAPADAESHLGGKPFALSSDKWPVCPICKEDMEFFLQLREVEPDKNVSLKTFYKCDCQIDKNRPIIYIREFKNPDTATIHQAYYENRTFDDHFPIAMEPSWSAPSWRVLETYNAELYKNILKHFANDDEASEDFYEDHRLLNMMISDNPFTTMYGYPEFYSADKDSVRCTCCNDFTEFYFQLDSEDEWNKGVLYCFVCPRTGTYHFLIN